MEAAGADRAFEEAEARLIAACELRPKTHWLPCSTGDGSLRARILEVGEGPPVLFVHGGGGYAGTWSPLLAHWRTVRAIVPDRPACGLSEAYVYDGDPAALRRHAVSFLASVLDGMEVERAIVVASSIGGAWATWLAQDMPARVSALALTGCPLGLLGTNPPLGQRVLAAPGLGPLLGRMMGADEAMARRIWLQMGCRPETWPLYRQMVDGAVANMRRPAYMPGFQSLLRSMLTLGGPRAPLDRAELERVRVPTLLLWGEHDTLGPTEAGRAACSMLPSGTFACLPCGHVPAMELPGETHAIVRAFLGDAGQAS